MDNKSQLLVIDGGTVKTEANGIVKGLGIVFGSESEPDQSSYRDFFTPESFIQKKHSFVVPLFYEHGLGLYDDQIGEATLTKSDKGWEASAVIDVTSDIGQKVYESVKANKHGFSTGAVSHMVKREAKSNGTNFLKKWVVGEISLTERPAERKAVVQAIKSVDGAIITEEAWPESANVAPFHVSLLDETDNVLWSTEDGTFDSLESIQNASKISIKGTYGGVSYNIYSYDPESESSIDISMSQSGNITELLAQMTNLLNKASLEAKNLAEDKEDFDTRVTNIVKNLVGNVEDNKDISELKTQLEDATKEIADLKQQLSDREDDLTNAQERMKSLEILAGAKETINKIKGK